MASEGGEGAGTRYVLYPPLLSVLMVNTCLFKVPPSGGREPV